MPVIEPRQQQQQQQQTNKMHMKNSLGKYPNSDESLLADPKIGAALANKKMQLIREEEELQQHQQQHQQQQESNGFHHKAPQAGVSQSQVDCEVFQDTQTLGPHTITTGRHNSTHSAHRDDNQDEPIVIFDTQNNTSIAQTARDQFAAALLRLQAGLDLSGQRLDAIESKVDDLVRQQKLQVRQQQNRSEAKGSWASVLLGGQGKLGTLLYLSWPVLVFVAMRTIERRNLLNKLS